MRNEFDFLAEWAVWAHLDSETNLELILLKGHLLLEGILDTTLGRNGIEDYESCSFFRKIRAFNKIGFEDVSKKEFIASALVEINRLRNKLAHEFHFEVKNGELQLWSSKILEILKGTKFTRYTFRTKIVHAFSNLAITILELR